MNQIKSMTKRQQHIMNLLEEYAGGFNFELGPEERVMGTLTKELSELNMRYIINSGYMVYGIVKSERGIRVSLIPISARVKGVKA